jgi:hypothetical protein
MEREEDKSEGSGKSELMVDEDDGTPTVSTNEAIQFANRELTDKEI